MDGSDLFLEENCFIQQGKLIKAKVYCKKAGYTFVALTQKEFDTLDKEKKDAYRVITCSFSPLSWGLFNEIQDSARETDELGNYKFNGRKFKEKKLFTILRQWDVAIKDKDGNPKTAPINEASLRSLSPEIAEVILSAYDDIMFLGDEQEKK